MSSTIEIETGIIENNEKDSVSSRKLAAAENRRNRKAARESRFRLLSDSSDEVSFFFYILKTVFTFSIIITKHLFNLYINDDIIY